MNSEGLLAVTDGKNNCIHLLTEEGTIVRSIGREVLSSWLLYGVAFDLEGNIWVTECKGNESKVLKLSQCGQCLETIQDRGSQGGHFFHPAGVSGSREGRIYICEYGKHYVSVHDGDNGKFLFTFGSKGSGPECFNRPRDITFASDGLAYVTDEENSRVCVWSKEGTFQRYFLTKPFPTCIVATSDNHLLITSELGHIVMVYTLKGQLIHQFGEKGREHSSFNRCRGICINNSGLVYIADPDSKLVHVF